MLQGFKDFILRGNVIDMAVGVVIGAAFTAVVTSFSDAIINPLVASIGGVDFSDDGLGFRIIPGNNATFVNFGAVITAVINFLLIAAVIYFVLIVPRNKIEAFEKERRGIDKETPEPTDTELLTEIRDLLAGKQQGTPGAPTQSP